MSENLEIANEIVRQLHACPENECLPLTACLQAGDFVAMKDGVMFKVKGDKGVNKVVVKLNAMDTYDIEFWYIKVGTKIIQNKVNEVNGIYNDHLVDTVWRNVVIV